MTARRPSPVEPPIGDKLRRALVLLPFAVAHPGATLQQLGDAVGATAEEVLGELQWLKFVGRPPFTPADLVDVTVEEGRVFVTLAQGLVRPMNFTAAEAAALDAAASLLAPSPGEPLARAREKVRGRLRGEAKATVGRVVVAAPVPDVAVATRLDAAVRGKKKVRLVHAGRERLVWPLARALHHGHWYLLAVDEGKRERRLFRLDRVEQVEVTAEAFLPRPSDLRARLSRPSLYEPGEASRTLRVTLRPGPLAAPAVARSMGFTEVSSTRADGGVATARIEGSSWGASLVLSLAGAGVAQAPADVRERIRAAAEACAERHA